MHRALLRAAYRTARRLPQWLPRRLRAPAHLAISRAWYDFVNRLDREGEARFFNYGWAPPSPTDSPYRLEQCQAALYERVVGGHVRDKDVLEVGCGRGGGAWWIWRHCLPRSFVGLDLSREAVEFCRRHYRAPGLHFVQGAAGSLPFVEGAFDAVVNVESSHAYPSMENFLTESARVLRPGGVLLLADFRPRAALDRLRRQVAAAGFLASEEEELSDGVLRALQATEAAKRHLIARKTPWFVRPVVEDFAGLRGTPIYTGLRSGTLAYVRFVWRKAPR